MPAFNVRIEDKTYRIEVPNPNTHPLQVIVDGQTFTVGITGPVPGGSPYIPPAEAQTHAIPEAGTRCDMPGPAAPPAPRVQNKGPAAGQDRDSNGADPNRSRVIAPMPGTIIAVEVRPGATVTRGQVLCVLEAMKMKNPIRCLVAGVVAEIMVSEGDTVAHGDVLLRLTPGGD